MVTFGAFSALLLRLLLKSRIPRPSKKRIRLRRQATRIMVTKIFPSARMITYPDHIGIGSLSPKISISLKWVDDGIPAQFFPSATTLTYDPYDHDFEPGVLLQYTNVFKHVCRMRAIAKRVRSYSKGDLNCAKKSPLFVKMAKRDKDYLNYNTRNTAVANVKPKTEQVIHT